jgi:light-harvesting protein B-800-850 alpha chain
MNQGTIWTVVKPTVGLPLLLGSVTVIAILVHLALINNTTWFPKYWNGAASAAAVAAPAAPVAPAKK